MQPHDQMPWEALPEMDDEERLGRAEAYRALMASRHSCRSFSNAQVPRAIIETAIRAAGTAPNGANHQPWHFAVISDPATKKQLQEEAEKEEQAFYDGKASDDWVMALRPLGTDAAKPYLSIAPSLIVVFGQRRGGIEPGDQHQNYYVTESVGIAVGILLSCLHAAGLATLTHTPAPMRFLNQLCNRPANEKPVMIIVVGHPADDATIPTHALRKKPLDQISSWI